MSDIPAQSSATDPVVTGPVEGVVSDARADEHPTAPATRPVAAGATSRRGSGPRRAVRRAGTVGTDESILRSTHRAVTRNDTGSTDAMPDAMTDAATEKTAVAPRDPALPIRALDDSDVGWGRDSDSNDDRLQRDRPPHW